MIYDLVVLPDGRLDTWLSITGVKLAAAGLSFLGWEIETTERFIACVGSRGVKIQNGCNGMDLLGLYAGFIIAYPGELKKRIAFLAGGIGLIFIANVFRIAFFALSNLYYPQYWDSVHLYSSYVFFYPIVLTLWYLWTTVNDHTDIFSGESFSSA
ncbi:MAG: archaeosortase/exosortase family protein [Candidatus Marinimicrobia bacterium]|nr:archaeosortase/exosortase family protein [Candidatus Neomarinimicrobiota bacterium]